MNSITNTERRSSTIRTAALHAVLALVCVALGIYFGFVSHPVDPTEGERPIAIAAFGDRALVAHAFQSQFQRLDAIAVRVVASQASSLHLMCRLSRLPSTDPGLEDTDVLFAELYQWTTTLDVPAGDHWQTIHFSPIDDSLNHWYRFELRLSDPAPGISLMASEDNPIRGGKLWIDGARQPGSLFIAAIGPTLYERFHLNVDPGLPKTLRKPAIQLAVAAVFVWALVTLVYALLFCSAETPEAPRPRSDDGFMGSAIPYVCLTLALLFFFLVPDNFGDNPANSLPFLPELVLFGMLCLYAGLNRRRLPSAIHRDEIVYLVALGITGAYFATRAIHAGVTYAGFDPCAAVAPSAFVRLECRLDASFSQNYAWKALAQAAIMLAITLVTAYLARTVPTFYRIALAAVATVGLIHASVGLGAIWFRVPQVVPPWIVVNPYGLERFTFLISYPGFVWLQMAPALAIVTWQAVYGRRTVTRVCALIAMIVLAAGIGGPQQRGGLLLDGAMIVLAAAATLVKIGHRRRTFESVRVGFAAALWAASIIPLLMTRSHTGGMFVAFQTRPAIWSAAIAGTIREHPLFGFGYTGWREFGRVAIGTPAEPLIEAAHSIWVRSFFELGAVGFVLVAVCVFGALAIAARNSVRLPGGLFLIACAATACLICISFEEPDFVRPVIAVVALLVGVCCGLPFRRSPVLSPSPSADVS